jgi:hypothetical protein
MIFRSTRGGEKMFVASHRIELSPSVREDPGYFYFNFEFFAVKSSGMEKILLKAERSSNH